MEHTPEQILEAVERWGIRGELDKYREKLLARESLTEVERGILESIEAVKALEERRRYEK